MFDESVTSFYSVGDYIQVNDNHGWIIEDNGFGAFSVVTDTSKLIKVNELDIDFRDNSKSIGLKEIAELKESYLDIIEVEVVYGCNHKGTISCKIDDAGPEQSMALNELCLSCERERDEEDIERYEQQEADAEAMYWDSVVRP